MGSVPGVFFMRNSRDDLIGFARRVPSRRRVLVLAAVSLLSTGLIACGGGNGNQAATPEPYAFPASRESHGSGTDFNSPVT